MDREKWFSYHNNRYLLILYAAFAVFSASPNGYYSEKDKEWSMVWDEPRWPEELEDVKYTPQDTVLEADPSEYGYRFGFIPTEAADAMETSKRISMRIDFEITDGRPMDRSYVEVIEIDKSHEGIPFNKFHYSNMAPMPTLKKSLEVPIPPEMMQKWMTKEFAQIGFILKFEFGMLSNVHNVTAKLPVLIFSPHPRPKCSEHTCCLTANKEVSLRGALFEPMLRPEVAIHRRCVPCLRASEDYTPDLANFKMFIHFAIKPEDMPAPAQLGQCRATEWAPLDVIITAKNNTEVHQMWAPKFNPASCECFEDFSADHHSQEQAIDHLWRVEYVRKANAEKRIKEEAMKKNNMP